MGKPSIFLSKSQHALPGILGGLGPLAHIEFEQRLLAQSVKRGALQDQDHPIWLLISAAATPDRTQSLQGVGINCTPWLMHYTRLLESMGADFLIVTCNTAHAFHPLIQPHLGIPWIHIMQVVSRAIAHKTQNVQRIGVMATTGTLQAQLYTHSLQEVGLIPVFPVIDSEIQKSIMQSIYAPQWGIKSSGVTVSALALEKLAAAMDWFQQQGADLVIAGCTELSVGLARLESPTLPWIDPLDVVAGLTLGLAFGEISLDSAKDSQIKDGQIKDNLPAKTVPLYRSA
jgi:aspartate racemase